VDKKQCVAKTKTGESCRAPAGPDGLCFLHANPNRARTLGQLGGLGNRRASGIDLQIPDDIGLADLRKLVVETIRQYASGELKTHDVRALVPLYNSLGRIIPAADLENRVVALESGLADQTRKLTSQQNSMPPPTTETVSANGDRAPEAHTDSPDADPPDGQDLVNQMNNASGEPNGGEEL